MLFYWLRHGGRESSEGGHDGMTIFNLAWRWWLLSISHEFAKQENTTYFSSSSKTAITRSIPNKFAWDFLCTNANILLRCWQHKKAQLVGLKIRIFGLFMAFLCVQQLYQWQESTKSHKSSNSYFISCYPDSLTVSPGLNHSLKLESYLCQAFL